MAPKTDGRQQLTPSRRPVSKPPGHTRSCLACLLERFGERVAADRGDEESGCEGVPAAEWRTFVDRSRGGAFEKAFPGGDGSAVPELHARDLEMLGELRCGVHGVRTRHRLRFIRGCENDARIFGEITEVDASYQAWRREIDRGPLTSEPTKAGACRCGGTLLKQREARYKERVAVYRIRNVGLREACVRPSSRDDAGPLSAAQRDGDAGRQGLVAREVRRDPCVEQAVPNQLTGGVRADAADDDRRSAELDRAPRRVHRRTSGTNRDVRMDTHARGRKFAGDDVDHHVADADRPAQSLERRVSPAKTRECFAEQRE